MTTFTVWRFDTPDGAEEAAAKVKDAQAQGMVTLLDHAVVSWPPGAAHPSTHHSHDEAKRGAG